MGRVRVLTRRCPLNKSCTALQFLNAYPIPGVMRQKISLPHTVSGGPIPNVVTGIVFVTGGDLR